MTLAVVSASAQIRATTPNTEMILKADVGSQPKIQYFGNILSGGSRRKRIADGSGTTIVEVNRLLKQFEDTRKVMKLMAGGGAKNKAMGAMRAMQGMRRR